MFWIAEDGSVMDDDGKPILQYCLGEILGKIIIHMC